MPADDLVLNVRQVAQYPAAGGAPSNASLLMQLGIGGPYLSVSPQTLVATALATGGDMAIAGGLAVQAVSGGSAQFSNGVFNVLSAQKACIVDFAATWGSIAGVPIATVDDIAADRASSVTSFNGRLGDVRLWIDDIICAGGAPIFSPRFQGEPRACTPPPTSNSSRLATTAFVATAVGSITGDFAPIDSPNFTGVPTAPTPALGSSDGQLATTAFVQNAIASGVAGVASFNTRTGAVVLIAADLTAAGGALLVSPIFTGVPAAPTAAPGTNTTQLATTAFVHAAVSGVVAGVASFNTRTGAVTLTSGDITAAGGALVATSVASFNGRTGSVNLIANDISGASGALLASPAFTGTPSAPTPPPGDSSTRLATTAFVAAMTGFAPLASPAFTGVPTAPTAVVGTNTTQLATTAFVLSEISASTAGVVTFNGRSGAVTLLANDITSAGGALLASPALTGTPSAPTAAPSTSTTQLATTAFVTAAIAAAGPFLPLAGGTLTGPLAIAPSPGGGSVSLRKSASGQANIIVSATGALTRWQIVVGDSGAESGSNAGSDFSIARYSDAGALLSSPVSIVRSSGLVTLNGIGHTAGGALNGVTNLTATIGSIAGINFTAGGQIGSPSLISMIAPGTIGGVGQIQLSANNTYSCGVAGTAWFQVAAYNFAQQSDARGKTNITLAPPGALDAVAEIPVHDFSYRSPNPLAPSRHIGWLAQEVHSVTPGNVLVGDDPDQTLSVELGSMLATLWQAVQELTAKVAALEAT
jgi:hypothetical protein